MLDQFEDHMTHTVIPCDFILFFFSDQVSFSEVTQGWQTFFTHALSDFIR